MVGLLSSTKFKVVSVLMTAISFFLNIGLTESYYYGVLPCHLVNRNRLYTLFISDNTKSTSVMCNLGRKGCHLNYIIIYLT
jgi:hypothetical protein